MRHIHLLILLLTLSACLPMPTAEPTPTTASAPYRITPEDNPHAPRSGDLGMHVAGVTITSVNLLERFDLTPLRVMVGFLGYMPGVCNELRIKVNPPDDSHRIFIEVYSLVTPDITCDRVFQKFETSILLGTYSNGRYTVWVNNELIGDFVTY